MQVNHAFLTCLQYKNPEQNVSKTNQSSINLFLFH